MTVSLSEPLRHLFARTGVTRLGASYSLSRATVTTFNQNTQNVFSSLAFRSGVAGQNQLDGIITSLVSPTFSFSSLDRAVGPHHGKDFSAQVQLAGVGGNVKYYSPAIAWRQFFPMKGLKVNSRRSQRPRLSHPVRPHCWLRGRGRSPAGTHLRRRRIRRPRIRHSCVFALRLHPQPHQLQPDKPGRFDRSARPHQCLAGSGADSPAYFTRLVSIGGDTQVTSNVEYRIPIVSQVTFAIFTDFGMTFNAQAGQLRQSVSGTSVETSPTYGCPTLVNGSCYGGVAGSTLGFSQYLKTVPYTNWVPRMTNGAELQVILPIVNAPFRIYYGYNPLRLYRNVPQELALPLTAPASNPNATTFRSLFPKTDAGNYTYQQAVQYYGDNYVLREPRKTFRITVSTTF